ncbi:hypothetical protein [Alistipes sp. ZOR0009]|uniref:hypothetical protein n=1 Tax=Alistipes sp. ZOR0009 TaxID=1339253 RepID=UPI000648ECC1|nr:hypothetical protein [Alistipes sp. ZOR0009]
MNCLLVEFIEHYKSSNDVSFEGLNGLRNRLNPSELEKCNLPKRFQNLSYMLGRWISRLREKPIMIDHSFSDIRNSLYDSLIDYEYRYHKSIDGHTVKEHERPIRVKLIEDLIKIQTLANDNRLDIEAVECVLIEMNERLR